MAEQRPDSRQDHHYKNTALSDLIYLQDNIKLKQKSKTQTLDSDCVCTMMTPEVSHPGAELEVKGSDLRSLEGH